MTYPRRLYPIVATTAIAAALPMVQNTAHAAAFALIEQNATGLGNAYAGGAAVAEDASTIFFNPAGMARLPGQQFIVAGHYIAPSGRFDNEGSTHLLQGATGFPLLGADGGDIGEVALVPNLYYSRNLNSQWTAGIGINAPFGLTTDYDDGWVGRYHALRSEILSLNINPSIAYRANAHWSFGFGVSVQYFEAPEISSAIDFGTLDALPATLGGFDGAFGLIPQFSDGRVELEGDDWSYGFNLGVLFELNANTRIGAAYRSKVKHELDGDADFTLPTPAIAATGLFVDTGVKSDVELPDSFSLSFYHRINSQWALMGDYTWTGWSTLEELRFEFDNPLQPDGVTTLEWEDSNRYSLGVTYQPNSQWVLRAGIAYDETPIPNAVLRTPRLPDEDRTWIAVGASYRPAPNFSIDVGYAHLFLDDAKIAKTPTGEFAVLGGLTGTYELEIDILSAQATWTF